MVYQQMVTFLQVCVVFLVLTNIASLIAAVVAVRHASRGAHAPAAKSAVERNVEALLRR